MLCIMFYVGSIKIAVIYGSQQKLRARVRENKQKVVFKSEF